MQNQSHEAMTQEAADERERLAERRLTGGMVYEGHFLRVRRDEVALPGGGTAHREFILHPGAVMVVPIADDGRLLLERQFRYPLDRVFWEFPAGKLDAGELGWHCAQRELEEETGFKAREWAYAGVLHNAIAYADEGIEIWFARGLHAGMQQLDEGEFVELHWKTAEELDELAFSGELTDAKTLIAMLWLARWREGRWPLTWRPVADPGL